MAEASIPVDLFNPGQVFACLGFLEAADILCGDAEGGFDWRDEANVHFVLSAAGERNPFEVVLEFLAEAKLEQWAPLGYAEESDASSDDEEDEEDDDADDVAGQMLALSETFPGKRGDKLALPIRLGGGNRPVVELGHWTDQSERENFKLYSGNRSAFTIARGMLSGTRQKPTKKQKDAGAAGDLKSKGVAQLWEDDRQRLIDDPLNCMTPMGGSFNFDPRGAWTAIDAGYSPNDQKHRIVASPVVEILAAWGLEHGRPERDRRHVRYAAWSGRLPPALARVAMAGAIPSLEARCFRFDLAVSGKNSVVTFAEQESSQ